MTKCCYHKRCLRFVPFFLSFFPFLVNAVSVIYSNLWVEIYLSIRKFDYYEDFTYFEQMETWHSIEIFSYMWL